eukprot:12325820-Heterocapsa_arctica.AAC.1
MLPVHVDVILLPDQRVDQHLLVAHAPYDLVVDQVDADEVGRYGQISRSSRAPTIALDDNAIHSLSKSVCSIVATA